MAFVTVASMKFRAASELKFSGLKRACVTRTSAADDVTTLTHAQITATHFRCVDVVVSRARGVIACVTTRRDPRLFSIFAHR